MPFRTPRDYEGLSLQSKDTDLEEVVCYVVWLEQELALAKLALSQQAVEALEEAES